MPRYEGMEELLQRLNSRFGQPNDAPLRVRAGPPQGAGTQTESQQYALAIESVMRLLHEAEQLHALLNSETVRSLTSGEHDDLVGLLGKVLQELWTCEVALQRVATYE
jgi:hypothetical protein